jgi:thiol-disulfide isomerase/thioredoxin
MAKVRLVYASWCPSCPAAKSFWTRLRQEIPFSYEEIDIDTPRGKELAERFGIRSVPTTLVGDRPYFVGVPDRQRAISLLKSAR